MKISTFLRHFSILLQLSQNVLKRNPLLQDIHRGIKLKSSSTGLPMNPSVENLSISLHYPADGFVDRPKFSKLKPYGDVVYTNVNFGILSLSTIPSDKCDNNTELVILHELAKQ
jgi:hypothetical protein